MNLDMIIVNAPAAVFDGTETEWLSDGEGFAAFCPICTGQDNDRARTFGMACLGCGDWFGVLPLDGWAGGPALLVHGDEAAFAELAISPQDDGVLVSVSQLVPV